MGAGRRLVASAARCGPRRQRPGGLIKRPGTERLQAAASDEEKQHKDEHEADRVMGGMDERRAPEAVPNDRTRHESRHHEKAMPPGRPAMKPQSPPGAWMRPKKRAQRRQRPKRRFRPVFHRTHMENACPTSVSIVRRRKERGMKSARPFAGRPGPGVGAGNEDKRRKGEFEGEGQADHCGAELHGGAQRQWQRPPGRLIAARMHGGGGRGWRGERYGRALRMRSPPVPAGLFLLFARGRPYRKVWSGRRPRLRIRRIRRRCTRCTARSSPRGLFGEVL